MRWAVAVICLESSGSMVTVVAFPSDEASRRRKREISIFLSITPTYRSAEGRTSQWKQVSKLIVSKQGL